MTYQELLTLIESNHSNARILSINETKEIIVESQSEALDILKTIFSQYPNAVSSILPPSSQKGSASFCRIQIHCAPDISIVFYKIGKIHYGS